MAETKTDPKPVGSAAQNTTTASPTVNDSVSLPLSGRPLLAGESSDPTVHKLLADKQSHQLVRDNLDPPVVDKRELKSIDAAIADIDDELAELGFPQESQEERKAALQQAATDAAKKDEDAQKRRDARAKAAAEK
jgi:hypothetical protein